MTVSVIKSNMHGFSIAILLFLIYIKSFAQHPGSSAMCKVVSCYEDNPRLKVLLLQNRRTRYLALSYFDKRIPCGSKIIEGQTLQFNMVELMDYNDSN